MPNAQNARKSRFFRYLGWGLGGLALVLVAVVGVALLNPSLLTEPIRAQVVPRMGALLGREVRIGGLEADFFPRPQVTISDVVVAGAPGEPAFIRSPEATVTVRFWPLVTSLGKDVELSALTLKGPEVNLVRRADGRWGYEDILEHMAQFPEEKSEREYLVSTASLEDGAISVHDYSAPGADKAPGVVALSDVDVTAENLGFGQDVEVHGKAALQSEEQNIDFRVAIQDLPKEMGTLPPGQWPRVEGAFSLSALSLERFRAFFPAQAGAIIRGGRIDLKSELRTDDEGNYRLEGSAALADLSLRGQAASGGFNLFVLVPNGKPEASKGEIQQLRLDGPGIALRGNAQFTAQPMALTFALEGDRLDTDALMAVLPAEEKTEETGESEPVLLPAQTRQQVAAARVHGTLRLKEVISGKLRATNLDARAVLEQGVLRFDEAKADLYEGRVSLQGTKIDLTQPAPQWALQADLSGLNLGVAMKEVSGVRPIEGNVTSSLSLAGEGNVWAQIREQLEGEGKLELAKGQLTSANLDGAVTAGIAQALEKLGRPGVGQRLEEDAGTALRDVRTAFEVEDGALQLSRPLRFETSIGQGTLEGAIGLDQSLRLQGTVRVNPETVARLTQQRWVPAKPVDVPVNIGGTLLNPAISGIDAAALVRNALPAEQLKSKAREEVQERTDEVKDRAKEEAKERLRGVFGK